MSRGPYWMPNARWGARMGEAKMVDPVVGGLTDPFHRVHMGITAENLAESHDISREEQDEFALESHRRAHAAQEAGKFDDEIVPVEVKVKKETVDFTRDEHVRPDASMESMAKLKPVFKPDGTVTAGNASGMNDAGAGGRADVGREGGGARRARARADPRPTRTAASTRRRWASARCRPCARRSTRPASRSTTSDVIELNEAFAAQALAVMKDLELDPAKVNPNGGAIALGHPVAATGSVITAKILGEMEREDHELGLVTLCIGGGQGIAMLIGRGIGSASDGLSSKTTKRSTSTSASSSRTSRSTTSSRRSSARRTRSSSTSTATPSRRSR